MPIFRFSKAFGVPSKAKAFLNLEGGVTRGEVPNLREQYEKQAEDLRITRQRVREQRDALNTKNQKIFQLKEELRAANARAEDASGDRSTSLEAGEPETGSLPDFAVIGAQKCGTTLLYQLLNRHPLVERAALKEIHYFDLHFEKGIGWYRSLFPAPRHKNGRKTVTGEACPDYLFHPLAPERMAEAVPDARLIVLLRNPVDRAYSGYHHATRYGRETRTFEEAVEAERATLLGEREEDPDRNLVGGVARPPRSYLARGIYVDQLLRWSRFFKDEQLLVVKSEDFFARTPQTLEFVLEFLGLPSWEPREWKVRNEGSYEAMSPATRGELEAFFEPHNQRLYEHLGVDFGW